mmetsp:Transcript_41971/g.96358  ORF Transcript_41971/g.96358 Transcript_41971/m.96358 type:complete len:743 (+) Transcript_41971:68-2296(+)
MALFRVGDLVQVWNSATYQFADEPLQVKEVATSPRQFGSSTIPAGSIRIDRGQVPLWITPESSKFLLRACSEPASQDAAEADSAAGTDQAGSGAGSPRAPASDAESPARKMSSAMSSTSGSPTGGSIGGADTSVGKDTEASVPCYTGPAALESEDGSPSSTPAEGLTKTPKALVLQATRRGFHTQRSGGLEATVEVDEDESSAPVLQEPKAISPEDSRDDVLQELDLMLQVVLSDGIVQPNELRMCDAFFRMHHITHEELMRALSVIGWSHEDWVRGSKVGGHAEEAHHSMVAHPSTGSRKPVKAFTPYTVPHRANTRVLIIGPGFGRELNPRQGALIEEAGFQVAWVVSIPNPETPGFQMSHHLPTLIHAIQEFKPHTIACASKGGTYMQALWQSGSWTGPTLMLNRNPSLHALPQNATVVLAHGSNDILYVTTREELEILSRTSTRNRCLMYYTCNSGTLNGGCTRYGDAHDMKTLLEYSCLPRLVDATLTSEPEIYLMRSWTGMLADERLEAERWLGYEPRQLQRLWSTDGQNETLEAVPHNSEEFRMIATMFRAVPKVAREYPDLPGNVWEKRQIRMIQRVENASQCEGSFIPYYDFMNKLLSAQGLEFEPGIHTRWLFHGSNAVDSIVYNPFFSFQPLTSGGRSNSLWGLGTYFARDARYAHDGGFCAMESDGTLRVLVCLVTGGMSCLGDPKQNGVLPIRQGHHRYNSSVDSLSNPEIFITQLPGAAYPAYVITFA